VLRALKSFLGLRPTGVSVARIEPEDRAAALRKIIGKCPICQKELDGHGSYQLATVVAEGPVSPGLTRIRELISRGDFSEAGKHREWKADGDIREFRALRCTSGEIALLDIFYRFKIWSEDVVQGVQRLGQSQGADLDSFVGGRWETL